MQKPLRGHPTEDRGLGNGPKFSVSANTERPMGTAHHWIRDWHSPQSRRGPDCTAAAARSAGACISRCSLARVRGTQHRSSHGSTGSALFSLALLPVTLPVTKADLIWSPAMWHPHAGDIPRQLVLCQARKDSPVPPPLAKTPSKKELQKYSFARLLATWNTAGAAPRGPITHVAALQ